MDFDLYYFMSYHPELPNLIMEVKRDDDFIAGLSAAVEKLLEDLTLNFGKIGSMYGV